MRQKLENSSVILNNTFVIKDRVYIEIKKMLI